MDVQSSLNTAQTSSSSPSSVVAPVLSPNSSLPLPIHPPTNEEIDAVIQQATSSISSDGRHVPLKDTRTQLFIGNLPYRVRWQDLKDLFRKAGTVLRADVSLGPDNRSRGHGTVLLATAEDAGRAVDLFNGYSWQSRVLEVRLDRLPSDFDNFSNSASGYHSPVLVSTHAPVIPALRPPYPFPTSIPPPINPLLSASFVPQIPLRGALDESYPDHSTVLGHDRPTAVGCISRNLFVGNLPFHCQWQDLKDLFRQAGTILRADVALGQDGRSRGFGTVVFATEHDAERAVNMFNGFEYNGRPLKVHYDKFMPSVGQSLTAPSSPLITSPFSGVINAAPLSSMANVSARPSSSRSTPLPLTHLTHSLDHTAYNVNQVKISTSPSSLNVFPSLPRSHPHAGLSHLGTAPVHQLPTHISTGPGHHDPKDMNPSSLRNESPGVGTAELPTPPSSSAGVPSAKGSRVSSPPLHLPQQDLPSHSSPRPPTVSLSLPSTVSTSMTYPEPTHSSQLFTSSSQRETPVRLEQTSPPSRQRAQTHPAHPGPISLPPPSAFVVPAAHNFSPMSPMFAPGIPMSPLQQPAILPIPSPHAHAHPHSPLNRPKFPHARSLLQHPTRTPSHYMTPSGLPPITPSMPSFQFVPGPPMLPHPDHSAVTLSPVSTMSPGAFWGRPGGNPLTNAAVGEPIMKGQNNEEFDYFTCASADASKEESYFLPSSQTGGRLADEILRVEPGNTSGIGEGRAPLVSAMENGISQEVSTSNGSSGRGSANERISNSGVDGVIEQLHRSLNISFPENTPCAERQDHSRTSPPFPHPPTRRSDSDPQEQGQRPSGKGSMRRASFTEAGHSTVSQRFDLLT